MEIEVSKEVAPAYVAHVLPILQNAKFQQLGRYTHHFWTNRLMHSLNVSYLSWRMADLFGADAGVAARAGLSECHGLSCRRVFARSLIVADEAIVVNTRGDGLPCLLHRGAIGFLREQSVVHSPCHAVEEEGCSGHLRSAECHGRHEADIPESVFSLAFQQCLTHAQEVGFEFSFCGVAIGQSLHHSHECRVDPSVATAPVAVFSVFLLVRRHVVFVSPPEYDIIADIESGRAKANEDELLSDNNKRRFVEIGRAHV